MNHRWTDASEALRKIDSDFVITLESDMRLDRLGLTPPFRREIIGTPKQPLSTNWHRLLEACFEVIRQTDILKASANCLNEWNEFGMNSVGIARQRNYHFRSWVIHAAVLCENSENVVDWSTKVYLPDTGKRKDVLDGCKAIVDREIRDRLSPIRNGFVHPMTKNRSWSKAATDLGYWEGLVALGMTPRKHLDEFNYQSEANEVSLEILREAATETERIIELLGSLLLRIESDISKENPACSAGQA